MENDVGGGGRGGSCIGNNGMSSIYALDQRAGKAI